MLCVFVDTVYILNTLLSTHQTIQYCALNSTYLYFQQTQAIISFMVSTQYGMGIVVLNTPLSHTIGHCWDDLPSQSFDWCKNNLPNQSVADTSKTTITTTDDTKRNLNNNSWKLQTRVKLNLTKLNGSGRLLRHPASKWVRSVLQLASPHTTATR